MGGFSPKSVSDHPLFKELIGPVVRYRSVCQRRPCAGGPRFKVGEECLVEKHVALGVGLAHNEPSNSHEAQGRAKINKQSHVCFTYSNLPPIL